MVWSEFEHRRWIFQKYPDSLLSHAVKRVEEKKAAYKKNSRNADRRDRCAIAVFVVVVSNRTT